VKNLDIVMQLLADKLKMFTNWSEMTLNYEKIVERYLKLNGVLGSSIPRCEIFSLQWKKLPWWPSCVPNENKKVFMDGVSNKYDAMSILTMKGI
jgi:hypothetical protein